MRSEWAEKRDARVRAAQAEVLSMFGEWDFSRPETAALNLILSRLYAAGSNAGVNPGDANQRDYSRGWRLARKASAAEVASTRADLMAPLDLSKRPRFSAEQERGQ